MSNRAYAFIVVYFCGVLFSAIFYASIQKSNMNSVERTESLIGYWELLAGLSTFYGCSMWILSMLGFFGKETTEINIKFKEKEFVDRVANELEERNKTKTKLKRIK